MGWTDKKWPKVKKNFGIKNPMNLLLWSFTTHFIDVVENEWFENSESIEVYQKSKYTEKVSN